MPVPHLKDEFGRVPAGGICRKIAPLDKEPIRARLFVRGPDAELRGEFFQSPKPLVRGARNMRKEESQIGEGPDGPHDQQEHIERDHGRSLSGVGAFGNRLANLRWRPYGTRVKNGKDNGKATPEGDSLEDRLGPEIDEALLALDELATDDPEEALATFDTLPEPVQALVDFQLLAARAHQALEQLDAARDILLALLPQHSENPDLHHQLGDVFEDLGEVEKANHHFEKTRALDLDLYEQLPQEEKQAGIDGLREALASIADSLKSRNLRVSVATLPSAADVLLGIDPRALSYYDEDTNHLIGYAGNIAFEFGGLEEDELKEALTLGLVEYLADDLELTNEELEAFGFELDESEED
jgi:tetratricopeptide (TPR) repeat protein